VVRAADRAVTVGWAPDDDVRGRCGVWEAPAVASGRDPDSVVRVDRGGAGSADPYGGGSGGWAGGARAWARRCSVGRGTGVWGVSGSGPGAGLSVLLVFLGFLRSLRSLGFLLPWLPWLPSLPLLSNSLRVPPR